MPDEAAFVEGRLDRVLTQYRESPRLLAVIRHGLEQRLEAANALADIPNHFDILTAVGDQLTIIGKWLGFPRCHCVCVSPPLFGFECAEGEGDPNVTIVGFCEGGVFEGCFESGTGEICLDDDEVYRRFLLVRRYQVVRRYSHADLEAAAKIMWGAEAGAMTLRAGAVCIFPGRDLDQSELSQVPLAFRALPIAPGMETFIHYGDAPIFGFGTGWAGFCEGSFLCPDRIYPYSCN